MNNNCCEKCNAEMWDGPKGRCYSDKCPCHTEPTTPAWEEEFDKQFEVREGSPYGHKQMFPCEGGYCGTSVDEIKDFVKNLLTSQRENLVQQVEGLFQDEHPVDCIDGETPVETYGYEATHNAALRAVLTIIRESKEV